MKTVAVIQSNYIPWKGYFDIIHDADLFIFHDDLQYTKGDWRNRNRIKTDQGCRWLTIPVGTSENRLICDVEIQDHKWARKHWTTIQQFYAKTPYFQHYKPFFEEIFLQSEWANLSVLNQTIIQRIAVELLGIETAFQDSRDYKLSGQKQARLLELLTKAGATHYISGPAAKSYIDPASFIEAEIELIYKDYAGYPEYEQRFPPFEHGVTILDLLFNCGPETPDYIWGWRE